MHMQNLIKSHWFAQKIWSRNEILTIIEGHNSVVNLRKFRRNNPNLDLVKVNVYAKFDQIPSIRSEVIEQNKILSVTKCHNSVVNLQKLEGNNSNPDLVKVKTAKFDQIPSILSQDIEQKWKFENNQGP